MTSTTRDGDEAARAGLVALSECHIARPSTFGGGVEIVVAAPAARGFGARLTDSLGLCLKRGGAHAVVSDGRRRTYPADSLCIRYPGCVWSSEVAPVGFVSIDLAPALLPDGVRNRPMQFVERDLPDLRRWASVLEDGRSPLRQDVALAELVEWLSGHALLDAEGLREETQRARAIRRARDFLEATLEENPSLDRLAAATGTNKFVLLRYFKRELGLAPHAYLVRLRVERARTLLARGHAAADVAAAVGFADQAHFSRHFRRIIGVTPAAYSRRVRAVVGAPGGSG